MYLAVVEFYHHLMYTNIGIGFLALILLIKLVFSVASFSSGTPGGIFFPILVLGATIGMIYAKIPGSYSYQ